MERLEELLAEALGRRPETRAAYLDEACAGDEDLRREIDELLELNDEAAEYFDRLTGEIAASAPLEIETATGAQLRIGPYRTIAAIGLKAVGPTRAFPVEVWIEEPDPRLHPGMTVDLRIFVSELEDVILAHVNDVFEDEAGTYVWVVDGSKAVRRDVATGRRLDERILITAGLATGDRLVVKGGDLLREGAAVTDTAAGRPPSASGG